MLPLLGTPLVAGTVSMLEPPVAVMVVASGSTSEGAAGAKVVPPMPPTCPPGKSAEEGMTGPELKMVWVVTGRGMPPDTGDNAGWVVWKKEGIVVLGMLPAKLPSCPRAGCDAEVIVVLKPEARLAGGWLVAMATPMLVVGMVVRGRAMLVGCAEALLAWVYGAM